MAAARPLRWAIFVVDLDPVVGHEQAGERRALIVSYEPYHQSGNLTICPITAARSVPRFPTEVAIPVGEAGQTLPAVILCQQVRTVSLRRALAFKVYVTDPSIRAAVRAALRTPLGTRYFASRRRVERQRHFQIDREPLYDAAASTWLIPSRP